MKIVTLILLSGGFCWGQAEECKPSTLNVPGAQYPCVHPDGRATFRLVAPDAHKVQVRVRQAFDMVKGRRRRLDRNHDAAGGGIPLLLPGH